jgi:hypothetical protein
MSDVTVGSHRHDVGEGMRPPLTAPCSPPRPQVRTGAGRSSTSTRRGRPRLAALGGRRQARRRRRDRVGDALPPRGGAGGRHRRRSASSTATGGEQDGHDPAGGRRRRAARASLPGRRCHRRRLLAQTVANHALTGRGAIDSVTAMTAHPLFDFVGWDERLAAEAKCARRLPDRLGVDPWAGCGTGCRRQAPGGGALNPLPSSWWRALTAAGDVLVLCGTTHHHLGCSTTGRGSPICGPSPTAAGRA